MAAIARWTTPSLTYKPSAVSMNTISEVYLVIKQNGQVIIEKTLQDAIVSENGYRWDLSQADSSKLLCKHPATIQVDYKCLDGKRYTTKLKSCEICNSAKNEVI